MASQRSWSETEMRLLGQVCKALNAKTEAQRNLLKTAVRNDLAPEWTRLVALMESNGPLSVLSEDEMKYMNTLSSPGSDQQALSHKIIDPDMIKAAIHDLHQYNNTLEKLLAKYKDYVRRSIATVQRPTGNDESSTIEQKLKVLLLKKEKLRKQIRAREDKINSHVKQLDGVSQLDGAAETDGESYDQSIKSAVERDIFETTFPSYDHILEKLNALQGELDHEAVGDDAILDTARRHASQIVLSLATRCRASLDMVFLEASSRYSKPEHHTSDDARAINDERSAVYSEIQSLWDEMVPLAHMVVEKDYLKPILNKIETCSERQSARDATVAIYTSAMLRFMNERLRVLLERISSLVYHLRILSDALAHMNTGRSQSGPIEVLGITRTLLGSGKENKTREKTLVKTIQRQMELYGPIPLESEKEDHTARMQIGNIDRYLSSRQRKGDNLVRNMHQDFERVVRAELTDNELASQLLLDSVVADSAAGCQSKGHVYEDQQIEDSVATVKSQAEEIRTIIKELLEDGAGMASSASDFVAYAYNRAVKQVTAKDLGDQERCAKQAAFVHKWGDSAGTVS
ncbi:hypothetical protein GGR53DRAFT_426013 [Hypoxylon sp. FL1150]|nr:hypothetical protein GGR53DRAFT_426013 [Hypoxylon sp. FL1150]